jgi:hypothetical protein
MTSPVITDELDSLVKMLCAKYPAIERQRIQQLVHDEYHGLAVKATIGTHLIPLTLNRCRKLLADPGAAESLLRVAGSRTAHQEIAHQEGV